MGDPVRGVRGAVGGAAEASVPWSDFPISSKSEASFNKAFFRDAMSRCIACNGDGGGSAFGDCESTCPRRSVREKEKDARTTHRNTK